MIYGGTQNRLERNEVSQLYWRSPWLYVPWKLGLNYLVLVGKLLLEKLKRVRGRSSLNGAS